MKKIIIGFAFCGIASISFSQAKTLNPVEKPKQESLTPEAKSINESKSHPVSRSKISRKAKPVLRRENYEVSPQKD
ncbi:MAG: hypothetical protein ACKN86_13945 [Crocinitomicaceae bacterium]